MSIHGKSFDAAQRAYDNMEPDYNDDGDHSREAEDDDSEQYKPVKAWVNASQEWCAKHGEYHAEGYAELDLESGVRVYIQGDAYGNTPVGALQNLRAELALHLPKLQKQLVDAIEEAREAL